MAPFVWVIAFAALGASAAEIDGWILSAEFTRVRGALERFRERPRPQAPGWDAPAEDDVDLPKGMRWAPVGAGGASRNRFFAGDLDRSPINTGFQAMGRAGDTGGIDGPGRKGNGRYRVVKNDPYEVAMDIQTGYVSGIMTLRRDPATGKDQMLFSGRVWDGDNDRWGAHEDKTNDVVITYDAWHDCGKIIWTEKGGRKEEGFWEGRAGRRSMIIELGGGYNHRFDQD